MGGGGEPFSDDRRGIRFGDLDGVGGGGESEAIEHILPSPPGSLFWRWVEEENLSPRSFFLPFLLIPVWWAGWLGCLCHTGRQFKLIRVKGFSIFQRQFLKAGVAQMVEHQPSKLRVAGSIPVSRSISSELFC
jgi:hypothetical protein